MTPLLLLPGMMCDGRLFGPQIDAFGADREVTVGDLGGADTVAEMAHQVLEKAAPRFALVGLSLGGIVAMEVIRQAPHRVERLALLDTNPRAELATVQAAREVQIAGVEQGQLRTILRDEMKPLYLAQGPRRQQILDQCMAMALTLGEGVFVRQSRALQSRPDQQASLARVAVPSLVLMGEQDQLCPLDRHQLMHQLLPQSRLVIIAEAGHLPTLEQPAATNAALKQWLES